MSQNVFNPAVLVLYLWPTVSWVALFSLICNMRSWNAATLSCSALWFLSRPHPAPCCTAASFHSASRSIWWFRFFFFSPALLSSLFFSLISYFLCGRRHFMFVLAQVAFGPRTEWAAMGGRKPDFPLSSSSQLPQSEPWTPSLLLHLPSSSSPAFYPFSLPSPSSPRSLTYGCSSTAKPTEMTTFLWLTVFVLHLKNLNFTLRDHI